MAAWMELATHHSVQLLNGVRKVCGQPFAVMGARLAHVGEQVDRLAPSSGVAQPVLFSCPDCSYTCDNSRAINCHMVNLHGHVSFIARCVNSEACSVCGLVFSNIANSREHVGVGGSKICLHNLVLRGVFMKDGEVIAVNADIASARRTNFSNGWSKCKVKNRCVRFSGPHLLAYGIDGNVIEPSKKGSPIGPARLHLPHQLIIYDADNSYNNVESCPAARFSQCTGRCTLCRGCFQPIGARITAPVRISAG